MENTIAVDELLWVEQQRINQARIKREGHKVLEWFLLVMALVVLTVAAATYLASF